MDRITPGLVLEIYVTYLVAWNVLIKMGVGDGMG
jgi:hypothetical protein